MKYGATNGTGSPYNIGAANQQFTNGSQVVATLGMSVLKFWCTSAYASNYPQQTFSDTPTTLTEFVQMAEVAAQLADPDFTDVCIMALTFANGTLNWWINNHTAAKFAAEYTEIYNLAVHLLTTYNNTGKTFVIQNWEGDWAFMDGSGSGGGKFIPYRYVERYAAFLATRQRAVEDARRATAHVNVKVLNAFECNRVVDRKMGRRRILNDIAKRVQPDVVSWSSYDATIYNGDDGFTWGADFAAWEAHWEPLFKDGLRAIQLAFPNSRYYVGELAFPENEDPDSIVDQRIQAVNDWCVEVGGVDYFLYWQAFGNDLSDSPPPTYRGNWLIDDLGNTTVAGTKMQELAGA